jgi:virginiamycin B lyase
MAQAGANKEGTKHDAISNRERFLQRTLGFITGAVVAAVLLAGCGHTYPVGAVAPTPPPIKPSVTSTYSLPTTASQPVGIWSSAGANAVWFTEESGDKIGDLNESAKITEVQLPNAGEEPYGITFGPDDFVWFTEYAANNIGRYDPTLGNFAEFPIPTGASHPTSIVTGADGALWFTESAADKVGRLDPKSGAFTEYAVGGSVPMNSVLGPDHSVWFTLNGSSQVGSITDTGAVNLYNTLTPSAAPYAIVSDSARNALWFTENAAGKLGEIVAGTGSVAQEISLTNCAAPGALQEGADGKFYIFCTGASPSILQYDPYTSKMKNFPLKAGSVPQYGIIAFDNKLYFTDSGLDAIEQFTYE